MDQDARDKLQGRDSAFDVQEFDLCLTGEDIGWIHAALIHRVEVCRQCGLREASERYEAIARKVRTQSGLEAGQFDLAFSLG